jgi:hypothetical protein
VKKPDEIARAIAELEKSVEHLVYEGTFSDGSVYYIRGVEARALEIKYPQVTTPKGEEEVIDAFRDEVEKHWQAKTLPTKRGIDVPWDLYEWESWMPTKGRKPDIKARADIAGPVLYPIIRAASMGLILSAATGGAGKVIALDEEGTVREYPSGKKTDMGRTLDDKSG